MTGEKIGKLGVVVHACYPSTGEGENKTKQSKTKLKLSLDAQVFNQEITEPILASYA